MIVTSENKTFHLMLQCCGMGTQWTLLAALYYRDAGAHREAAGLALVPKLKYEHIHLTTFSKMRVDLAAQVPETLFNVFGNFDTVFHVSWMMHHTFRFSASLFPRLS